MKKYGIYLGILIAVCLLFEVSGYAKYDRKLSHIMQKNAECALCGNGKKSLKSIYGESTGIGLICLNDWRVVRLLLSPDEPVSGSGISYLQGEDGSYRIQIEYVIDNRISLVKYTPGKQDTLDITRLSELLCGECLEKTKEAVTIYGDHDGRNASAVCLIEFPAMELHPIQQSFQYYVFDDYYVQSSCRKGEITMTVFRIPQD